MMPNQITWMRGLMVWLTSVMMIQQLPYLRHTSPLKERKPNFCPTSRKFQNSLSIMGNFRSVFRLFLMYLKRPVHQIGLLRWVLSFEQVSRVWAFQSRSSEMSADGFQWFVVGLLLDAEKHSSLGHIFHVTSNLATSFLHSLAIGNSGIYWTVLIENWWHLMMGMRQVPDHFCCKITMDIFRDPVITPSGITYERSALLEHLRKVSLIFWSSTPSVFYDKWQHSRLINLLWQIPKVLPCHVEM